MFLKKCFSSNSRVHILDKSEIKSELASPEILARLEKHAKRVQSLAPRSDDFLYFSIIFLKAAEACLIDENGDIKKVGEDKAWGYFDDTWHWHGNIKPHKNSNLDIFPESELKKAARDWIGRPLCVDHKSDTVDGVRGIILDTYYDEKRKQVVGLCALDKVNYPDLARKVATGVIRFGSMGTAVEKSICSECANVALSPSEYCAHISKRAAWGEINVGLKPIEYSLVVQPAEPGAILLRCIASLESKKGELNSYGVDDVDGMLKTLTALEANALDVLLDKVCTNGSCSLTQRKEIVSSFVKTNGFSKQARDGGHLAPHSDELERINMLADTLAKLSATGLGDDILGPLIDDATKAYSQIREQTVTPESTTSGESIDVPAQGITGPDNNSLESATRADTSMIAGVSEPAIDTFEDTGVNLQQGSETNTSLAARDNLLEKFSIKSITEDIMNEAIKRRRAEARRKIAYHQGGTAGIEPNDYKSKPFPWTEDKHMTPNPKTTGKDGLMNDDQSIKEKLKRAEVEKAGLAKSSYFQGGEGKSVEPSGTFKSEDYKKYWNTDKHMHQTKSMGGATGTFPGDEKTKAHQKRASYDGPALKTRVRPVKLSDGTINKSASQFEVYSGDKLVIATTAGEIWGSQLENKWKYFASKEYGKDVVQAIRQEGLNTVAFALTKSAQDLTAPAAPDMGAGAGAAPEMGAAPDLGDFGADLDQGAADPGADAASDPRAAIEEALTGMEEKISEVRTRLDEVSAGNVDVDVNVGGAEEDADKLALSKQIFVGLKTALADAENSADELALLTETYEGSKTLTASQKLELSKLAFAALNDASRILGEADTLMKMADLVSDSMIKTSEYIEEVAAVEVPVEVAPQQSESLDTLVAEAKKLRMIRRANLLKEAEELLSQVSEADDKVEEAKDESKADDVQVSEAHDNVEEVKVESKADDVQVSAAADKVEDVVASANPVKEALAKAYNEKKADEEKESFKIKLRRAYDLSMEMQKKGFIETSRAALNEQVDRIMEFDSNAFEAFKDTIATAKPAVNVKIASADLGGLNIGMGEDTSDGSGRTRTLVDDLNKLWS